MRCRKVNKIEAYHTYVEYRRRKKVGDRIPKSQSMMAIRKVICRFLFIFETFTLRWGACCFAFSILSISTTAAGHFSLSISSGHYQALSQPLHCMVKTSFLSMYSPKTVYHGNSITFSWHELFMEKQSFVQTIAKCYLDGAHVIFV